MSDASTSPRLTVTRTEGGQLRVGLAGDWTIRGGIPKLDAIERELAGGGVSALAFEVSGLGRWDSGLLAFLFKCAARCEENRVGLMADTLPPGVARLIRLAQAVPEKKDAVRQAERAPFLQRVGEVGMAAGRARSGC
jgi:phospholipid/cholesterol/gamma-HCH transport system permease protein